MSGDHINKDLEENTVSARADSIAARFDKKNRGVIKVRVARGYAFRDQNNEMSEKDNEVADLAVRKELVQTHLSHAIQYDFAMGSFWNSADWRLELFLSKKPTGHNLLDISHQPQATQEDPSTSSSAIALEVKLIHIRYSVSHK